MPKRPASSAVDNAVWERKDRIRRRGIEASAWKTALTDMLMIMALPARLCSNPRSTTGERSDGEEERRSPPVDGGPRRLDLVRRQAGALAQRDHPRPHPLAA